MNRNRLVAAITFAEVVALEHARDGMRCRQLDHLGRGQFVHPRRVVDHLGFRRIEDFEHLRLVSLGIALDVLARKRRARRVLAGRVADHAGEIADQKQNVMTEVL